MFDLNLGITLHDGGEYLLSSCINFDTVGQYLAHKGLSGQPKFESLVEALHEWIDTDLAG